LGKVKNVLLLFDLFLRISIASKSSISHALRDDRTYVPVGREIPPGHAALSDFRRCLRQSYWSDLLCMYM
jgi:hypothetical protein